MAIKKRAWIRTATGTILLGVVAAVSSGRRAKGQTASAGSNPHELELPPNARDPSAVEVLRVWAVPGEAAYSDANQPLIPIHSSR